MTSAVAERVRGWASVCALLALLAAPVVVGAHVHADLRDAAGTCTACIVALHAAATAPIAPRVAPPAELVRELTVVPVRAHDADIVAAHAGRAPPPRVRTTTV